MKYNIRSEGFFSILALLVVAGILMMVLYNQNLAKSGQSGQKSGLEQKLDTIDSARDAKSLIEQRNQQSVEGM